MKPRIIGYEIYTGEDPKGKPLFKVYELVDMGDRHVNQCVFTHKEYDEADAYMRTRKKWDEQHSN